MCQGYKDLKNKLVRDRTSAIQERDFKKNELATLNESKSSFDAFIASLVEYMQIIGDYAASLTYIGQCLKGVVINDEPFDRNQCAELATSMNNVKAELDEIKTDFQDKSDDMKTKISSLSTKIEELEEEIKGLKIKIDNINVDASCGKCEECKNKEQTYITTPIASAGSAGGCFLAGTKVHTKEGFKNIEDIKVGDLVLSYDEEEKTNSFNKVKELLIHENNNEDIYELSINDKVLKVTEKHRFYIVNENDYSWIAAKDLKVNDQIMLYNGEIHNIDKIESYSHFGTVYNLEVENHHNYYVSEDGILVHNVKLATEVMLK